MSIRGGDQIADWIETALLVRGVRPLGFDSLFEYFESRHGLEPQMLNIGLREMSRRASVLKARYPYVVNEYAVSSTAGADNTAYVSTALMAPGNPVREYVNASPTETMVVLFEDFVAEAAAQFWGQSGRALRFGWPSTIGRPPEFDHAVRWLAGMTGLGVGQGYRQPRRKDGGVDVVAWRPFEDGRTGFPVMLIQCTLQSNLVAKGEDVDLRLWASWLAMDVDPLNVLATPAALRSGTVWNELALKCMILDRLRLIELAPTGESTAAARSWVASTISDLTEGLGEVISL